MIARVLRNGLTFRILLCMSELCVEICKCMVHMSFGSLLTAYHGKNSTSLRNTDDFKYCARF